MERRTSHLKMVCPESIVKNVRVNGIIIEIHFCPQNSIPSSQSLRSSRSHRGFCQRYRLSQHQDTHWMHMHTKGTVVTLSYDGVVWCGVSLTLDFHFSALYQRKGATRSLARKRKV